MNGRMDNKCANPVLTSYPILTSTSSVAQLLLNKEELITVRLLIIHFITVFSLTRHTQVPVNMFFFCFFFKLTKPIYYKGTIKSEYELCESTAVSCTA